METVLYISAQTNHLERTVYFMKMLNKIYITNI